MAAWSKDATFPGGYSSANTAGECLFDARTAQMATEFFPGLLTFLGHYDERKVGQPFELETWQQNIVANLYGWKRKDGTRRYRTAYIEIPRKAGKSAIVAGLGLFGLLCEPTGDNQVYCCAASSEQASVVFTDAKQHIIRNPAFARRIHPKWNSLEYKDAAGVIKGKWKVLSSDGALQHGLRPNIVLADELHKWRGRELWDAMQTGRGNRAQPLTIVITTAGNDRNSICWEQYNYACGVRDGIIDDPSFLPVIYEARPEDDWTSEATWRKAQPNLGVSVPLSYYEDECRHAQASPIYENTFRQYYLNQWCEQEVRWLPMSDWDECGEAFDSSLLIGHDAWVAIDFGWRDDYAAMVTLVEREGHYFALPQFWLPKEGSRDKRGEPTQGFIRRTLLTLTDGNATDIQAIYNAVKVAAEKYNVREVVVDPWNARAQGQYFQEQGYSVVEFSQTKANYNEPCRMLESLLKERKIHHAGHAILRWMASNTAVEMNGLGLIMPKKKRTSEKIDGICALTMALGRAMMTAASQPSYYANNPVELG